MQKMDIRHPGFHSLKILRWGCCWGWLVFFAIMQPLYSQEFFDKFLHYDWRQSISTHETARVLEKDQFALTLAVNNYFCCWSKDFISHDLLLYDIVARYGVFKNFEIALKYSYPSTALIRAKYQISYGKRLSMAVQLGVGQYKLTNQSYKTDYIVDIYPGVNFDLKLYKTFKFYFAPKFIYSLYIADRFAKSENPPRQPWKTDRNRQVGYVWGFSLGKKTMFTWENTWHWGDNEGIKYKIHQQGISVTRVLD